MQPPRFNVGDPVTIPNGHGRESGVAGTIAAIQENHIGRFYLVDVPSTRSPSGHTSVPVLVKLLDLLSAPAQPRMGEADRFG